MSQSLYEGGPRSGILNQVVEGMAVYDRDQKRVGKVRDIFFGSGDDEADQERPGPAPDADVSDASPLSGLANAMAGDDTPAVLRARLLRQGYVQIDSAGLFAADRYATPEQIASVGEDRVVLNVTADELVER